MWARGTTSRIGRPIRTRRRPAKWRFGLRRRVQGRRWWSWSIASWSAMARAMSNCARCSTGRALGATFWICTRKRRTGAGTNEARSLASHRGGGDVHSRGGAHDRRGLWRSRPRTRRRGPPGDAGEPVCGDGTRAELFRFLSRARAGRDDIPDGRGDRFLAAELAGEDGHAAAAPDSGDVPGGVRGAGSDVGDLLVCRAGDWGSFDCGLFGDGDCWGGVGGGGRGQRGASASLTPGVGRYAT